MPTPRVKPLVVFRKPKACPVPIPAATQGVLIIEYRAHGRRVAQSTGIKCLYRDWLSDKQRIRGTSADALRDNGLLEDLLAEARDACYELRKQKLPPVPARARAIAQGQQAVDETLLESWVAWQRHQQARAQAGEILPDTARLPERRLPLLRAWLTATNRLGLLTRELSAPVARDFARWLLTDYPTVTQQSFANKCARLLSECAACALERGALPYHPVGKLKLPKPKARPLTFLTEAQLQQVATAVLPSSQLRRTRDAFLLICYTGFAHVDARAFDPVAHVSTDPEGLRWVVRPRQKSGQTAYVALLPQAEALLTKYEHLGRVPVPSNQKMNQRLHELEALLQLPLSLTCHVGRRTCGMLLLNAGLTMEAVSKWLGHASVKMTESLYSSIQQGRIARELRDTNLLNPPTA